MANRVGSFNTFASLTTAQASNLDANFTTIAAAFNDASLGYANGVTDVGSANNYVVTPAFGAPSGFNAGFDVRFIASAANTGNSTLTVNPLASAPIVDWKGNALVPGAIQAGALACVTYVGGAFRLNFTVNGGVLYSNPVVTTPGTTTVACGGASVVTVIFDTVGGTAPGNYLLTLTGVLLGAHLDIIWFMANNTQQFQMVNCTDSAGNAVATMKSGDWAGGVAVTNDPSVLQNWGSGLAQFIGFCFRDTRTSTTSFRFLDFYH